MAWFMAAVSAFFLSGRSISMRAMPSLVSLRILLMLACAGIDAGRPRSGSGQLVPLEILAQLGLEQLAGGGVRQLLDEYHVVGQPPLRDLALVEFEQFLARDLGPGFLHHDQQRPFVPFRVIAAG